MINNTIEWHQAQELPEHNQNRQAEKLAEFLDSDCELMTGRDLQYYADETGKDLDWIMEHGRNIHDVIKESYRATGGLDDVWDYDPFLHFSDDDEDEEEEEWDEEDEKHFIDMWRRDGFRVPQNQTKLEL